MGKLKKKVRAFMNGYEMTFDDETVVLVSYVDEGDKLGVTIQVLGLPRDGKVYVYAPAPIEIIPS